MTRKQKKNLVRIGSAAALLAALHFAGPLLGLPADGPIRFACYLVPYLIVGYDVLVKAFRGILNGQVLDESFLMAVATIGAIALAIFSGSGDYVEAIAVMLFYQVGEWFQSYAVGKSRRDIAALMDIRPDVAHLERNGKLETVAPDEVPVGSRIVVNPGEKVPLDGLIVAGSSTIDTAALTGESLPRSVGVGDEILSGSVNGGVPLTIETTKAFGESTVSKILELVENASSRKSKSENFISRFARIYTPAVVGAALALAVLPPLARLVFTDASPEWSVWTYRALTFLVASCPCALVVSIPLGFFAGLGGASRAGVLIKGSNHLEQLARVETVVFDKTGTLTKGVFEVNAVHHNALAEKELIACAALAESASSHPIARSLIAANGGSVDRSRVADIREVSGEGVMARVDGRPVAVGNDKLMARLGLAAKPCHHVGTILHVAIDGAYAGHIVISDVVKPTSAEALRRLSQMGVAETVMLTGDAARVADKVAGELGVDQVYAELLPGDKVTKVEELLARPKRGGTLAFVGDGLNDAPVLRRADAGVAMGGLGSDAAIEAADVVLMDDDPLQLWTAVKIARGTMRIVRENIVFSIGVKLACLGLVALGLAGMWLAVFADVGVMVLAVLNAMRTLFVTRRVT